MYDGAVKRTLVGPEITERALIASALNHRQRDGGGARPGGGMKDWRFWFAEQRGTLLALAHLPR